MDVYLLESVKNRLPPCVWAAAGMLISGQCAGSCRKKARSLTQFGFQNFPSSAFSKSARVPAREVGDTIFLHGRPPFNPKCVFDAPHRHMGPRLDSKVLCLDAPHRHLGLGQQSQNSYKAKKRRLKRRKRVYVAFNLGKGNII